MGDLKKEEPAIDKEAYRDNALMGLPNNDGWQTFNKLAEARIQALKVMIDPDSNGGLIDTNDDPSVIGIKYLVVSFAIYQLRALLNIPNAVVQAQRLNDQQRKTSRTRGKKV